MALYSYQALARDGKRVQGTLDAASASAVREALVKQGVYPVKIEAAAGSGPRSWWSGFFMRSVDMKELIFFTKQLALLLRSGVPLYQALELLSEQSEGYLQTIVIALKDDIKEGRSLASALERYSKVFDTTYVQLVRAGEASGRLEVILERLSSYLERRQEITKRVKKALSYPLMQLVIMLGIVGVLLAFVVPQIAGTFASEGTELPWPTRLLITLSDAITGHYVLLFVMLVSMYVGYRWFKATDYGARALDALKLRLPLVRYFSKMGTVVQFSRTLGMLEEGGVNIAESLQIVCKIVENRVLTDALNEARENIIKQGHISEYLKKTNIFPPIAIYLINTGEQSGHLGEMLLTVAQYYETELTELSDSLSSKLAPLMTLVMALLVGFIVMSIVLPLVKTAEIMGL